MTSDDILRLLRVVPDFPKPGIFFRDISPLLGNPRAFEWTIHEMSRRSSGVMPDVILAIESRGFVFGAPLAIKMGLPLCMARKPGKLPGETVSIQYGLEYGADMLHMQIDAVPSGSRVLIVDDVLATGGTAAAAGNLVRLAGGVVGGYLFLAEIQGLAGRDRLSASLVEAVVQV